MALSLKTHDYKIVKGRAVLTGLKPYARLSASEGPPVFIQGGLFFAEGGQEIPEKNLPEWLWDEVEKMSERSKQEVGLSEKSDRNSIKSGAAKSGASK